MKNASILGLIVVFAASVLAFNFIQTSRTSTDSEASGYSNYDGGASNICRTDLQCTNYREDIRGRCVNSRCVYDSQNSNSSDMGLKVQKSPLVVSWTGPENPSATARYVVTIRKADGTLVSGAKEKTVDTTIKTADFSTLTLPAGNYYAQLRYVMSKGEALKQTKNFTID